MNNLDKSYQALLQDILDNGVTKKDRTGTGTISVFGRQIRHKMSEGFPLLTTKKMAWKQIVTELLWFLRGDTNIRYLVDNNCHIWDGDAYKRYINSDGVRWPKSKEDFIECIKTDDEFAEKWGELGPVYGRQWRNWDAIFDAGVDQIAALIYNLKTNPDSRRMMVNAWNVGEVSLMVLPPCNNGFQVYTRELSRQERSEYYYKHGNSEGIVEGSLDRPIWKDDETAHKWYNERSVPTRAISLMWNQRSVDTFLGLPFNIASYGLLLEIIAKAVNMVPDELIGNLGDVHLYLNHIEQAKEQIGQPIFEESPTLYPNGPMNEGIKKQIVVGRTREPFPLPTLDIHPGMLDYDLDKLEIGMFKILNYQSHPAIKAPLSN
jgi:thymidylate synthase